MSFKQGLVISLCLVGISLGQNTPLVIQNESLKVSCQYEAGTFRITRVDSDQTLAEGRFMEVQGPGRIVEIADPCLGQGQAIAVGGAWGRNARVEIFPNLPFVVFQGTLHNSGAIDVVKNQVALVSLDLAWPGLADTVTTLGTGGLKPAAQAHGSYVWLAVADPGSRAGVVGAWLTQTRASGLVFPSVKAGRVSMLARSDYGHLLMHPGQNVDTETFALGFFADARVGLETWADLEARLYHVHLKDQPAGYCTGYANQNGAASNAESLVTLVQAAAKKLKPYGMDVIQIDDGWQAGRAQGNGPNKNFTASDPNGPFPKGMLAMSNRIRALGFTAGLFCMPFSGTFNDPWFASRQPLFVKTTSGEPFDTTWAGTSLDLTVPETQTYVSSLVRRLCEDWGYDYLKIAGLFSALGTRQVYPNEGYREDDFGATVFHDPDLTPIEIYRQGLQRVRQAAGPDTYLLGGSLEQNMRPYGASFGLVDGMRIGLDTGGTWELWSQRAPVFGARHYFLHNRLWHNDPDAVFVRTEIPLEQARAICSWTALSGQLFVDSDWLPGLPEERWKILQRTITLHPGVARPVDLFEHEPARIWTVTDTHGPVRRDVVGLYNWTLPAQMVDVTPQRLGLPEAKEYVAYDFWAQRFLPPFKTLHVPVNGQSCRVLAIRPTQSVPQLLSTNRHVTQGMIDVLAETWDAQTQTLRGKSKIEAADPYELDIIVPVSRSSWRVQRVDVADKNVDVDWRQQGPRVRVTLTRPQAGEVDWAVIFDKEPVSPPAGPQEITLLKAEADTQEIHLSWKPCRADVYRLTRQDGRVVETESPEWTDRDVISGRLYVYQVQAVLWDQASSATEVSIRAKTSPGE